MDQIGSEFNDSSPLFETIARGVSSKDSISAIIEVGPAFPGGIDDKDTILIKQVARGWKNGIPNWR